MSTPSVSAGRAFCWGANIARVRSPSNRASPAASFGAPITTGVTFSGSDRMDSALFLPVLSALIAPFTAPVVQFVKVNLSESSQIVYRPLEARLPPRPWSKGSVVLIGDAMHATTPHLASGACIGIEDAIVLAHSATIEQRLHAIEARRWERCRKVVENSVRLGEIEITGGDPAEHGKLMRESMMALAAPV